MTHRTTRRSLLGLLLAGAAVLALPSTVFATGPAPTQRQAKFEIDFLTGMIDHHAMAVMMGSLCDGRAFHPELLQLCADIVSSQSQEIKMMQSWLTDWYGIEHEPEMSPGDQKKMARLAELSGAEFEIMFMEMMIRHHRNAVGDGERCVARAYHPELIELCQTIVASQSAEIAMMESWLCQWYDLCPSTR